MRILVSGATGFAGRHLLRHLGEQYPDATLHGTTLAGGGRLPGVTLHSPDLRAPGVVSALVQALPPGQAAHLAARSSPRRSFAQPWATIENNLRAQVNLLEACSLLEPQPRVLVVTSGDIYDPVEDPLPETSPFLPTSPYAVSKIAQDMHALQLHLERGLPVMRARPFNFIGPGQAEGFVAPDFAWQIARIEAGLQPAVMRVGNLAAQRDFCDVRDVVHAFALLLMRGEPGSVCNVASGEANSIQFLLDTLLAMSAVPIEIEVDQTRFVPLDVPLTRGDNRKLRRATGWQPRIPLEQSLHDLLQACRKTLRA